MEDIIDCCDGSIAGVASFVAYHIATGPRRWVYTGTTFMHFDGTLWVDDGDGIRLRSMIKDDVRPLFAQRAEHFVNQQAVSHSKVVTRLDDTPFLDRVMHTLRSELLEAGFHDRLDNTPPHLIAFTNGVWDLERKAFRPATPKDMLSVSTGYAFSPVKDDAVAEEVASYLERVFPNPDLRCRVLELLARHLHGANVDDDDCLTSHVGERGSGLSLFFRALKHALGAYAVQFDAGILVSRPMPDLAAWRACRILYSTDMANSERDLSLKRLKKLHMFKVHLLCGPEHHAASFSECIHYEVFRHDPRLKVWIGLPAVRMELFRHIASWGCASP